jgi:alpha-L-glutamate ligase-like protein
MSRFMPFSSLQRDGILGLNARNAAYILPHNPRHLCALADDKIRCKERLRSRGVAVPELLGRVHTQHHAANLQRSLEGMGEFVVKPANGSGGDGILVITARRGRYWVTPTGRLYEADEIQYHVSGILNGMYSLAGLPDEAMLEALVHPMPVMRTLAPEGVPDIRVIVYRGIPVMAMTRLPTRRSGGKANLHQGAIGAGIDMCSGRTTSAVMDNRLVDEHPDTGAAIAGFLFPDWPDLLALAARCYDAVELGYLGVDIVLDARLGPLVLELNARPGLNIQIANRCGLWELLKRVDSGVWPSMPAEERVALGQEIVADVQQPRT